MAELSLVNVGQISLKNDVSDVVRKERLSHFLWLPIMDKNTIVRLFHG
jgi:hypothetical protein